MKRLLLALSLTLPAWGCRSLLSSDAVQIRVENASARTLTGVGVAFPSGWVDYGTLAPGESSTYRELDLAYRIATVEATIDGELQRLQVEDYMGEAPLASGRYAYRLGLGPDGGLTLELVEE